MNSKEDLGRKKGRRLSADDLFNMEGKPSFLQAFPLSLQHVAAMIVGCVTPAIIVANAAGLSDSDSVILIQAALFVSALSAVPWQCVCNRFGFTNDYGYQFCVCSDDAGYSDSV